MKQIILLTLGMFATWTLLALTPVERQAVTKALDYAKQAKVDYGKSQQSTIEAWDYATKADQHAYEVEQKIGPLQKQIDDSHTNEANLAKQVAKYRPFYDQCHKFWGAMGIIVCFGILAGHILILCAFVALLLVAFWALSLVFPVLGPIVSIGTAFLAKLWNSVARRDK